MQIVIPLIFRPSGAPLFFRYRCWWNSNEKAHAPEFQRTRMQMQDPRLPPFSFVSRCWWNSNEKVHAPEFQRTRMQMKDPRVPPFSFVSRCWRSVIEWTSKCVPTSNSVYGRMTCFHSVSINENQCLNCILWHKTAKNYAFAPTPALFDSILFRRWLFPFRRTLSLPTSNSACG